MRMMKLIRLVSLVLLGIFLCLPAFAEDVYLDEEFVEDVNLLEAYDEFYTFGFGEDEFIMMIKDILGYTPLMNMKTANIMVIRMPEQNIEFPMEITMLGIHFKEDEFYEVVANEDLASFRYEFYTRPGESWYEFEEEKLMNSSLGTLAANFKLIRDEENTLFISCYDEILRLCEDDICVIDDYRTLISSEALSQVLYNWNMKN